MDRRQALVVLGRGAGALLAVQGLGACGGSGESKPATEVDLMAIPDGGRLEIDHLGRPVELRRTGSVVEARSLWCTHYGCVVHWDPSTGEYVCPCHDGRFDSRGRPIAGPPTAPLRLLAVSLTGDTVTIEGT
jgi:Rieske Fe-S protein